MHRKFAVPALLLVAFPWSSFLLAQCSGQPPFTCSDGGPSCVDCQWTCGGATECSLPPPNWSWCYDGGSSVQCTGSGWQCEANPGTPIIIDTAGEGYYLTSLNNGVSFQFFPGKPAVLMSWTDGAHSNGFLVLDRNNNGFIDDGSEMFGSETPQPSTTHPNGFNALAVYDLPSNGGNGNGYIDPGDQIYAKLRVWIDSNHNGISEPGELHTLEELGISRLSLNYHLSPSSDQYGNRFRYEANLLDGNAEHSSRFFDVIMLFGSTSQLSSFWSPPQSASLSQLSFVKPKTAVSLRGICQPIRPSPAGQ